MLNPLGNVNEQVPIQTERVANAIVHALEDPEEFVRRAIKGFQNPDSDGKSLSINERVQNILDHKIGTLSAAALEYVLNHAAVVDPDENSQGIIAQALDTLKIARAEEASLYQTANKIWKSLNSHHIVFCGILLNKRVPPDEVDIMPHKCKKTPVEELVACQKMYDRLCEKSGSPSSPQIELNQSLHSSFSEEEDNAISDEELQNLIAESNERITYFCEKSLHYSTMYALDSLFKPNIDPSTFTEILQEADYEKRYLEATGYGKVRRFFHKHIYRLTFKFIKPIIKQTIYGMTHHARAFFNQDSSLQKFSTEKIMRLNHYFGRIETERHHYLRYEHHAGTFQEFLEQNIQSYGEHHLTEEEIISRLGFHIVERYIRKPTVTLCGLRIPFFSNFCEKIIHSVRKKCVHSVIERTQIIDTILQKSTSSAKYAQLGIKKMLQKKLSEIAKIVTQHKKAQAWEVTALEENPLAEEQATIIQDKLNQAIEQCSYTLHHFIQIEACNGDARKLRQLDNRIDSFIKHLIGYLQSFVSWEIPSPQTTLENTTASLVKTSLLSIFDDKQRQIELQLKEIFDILIQSYDHTSIDEIEATERKYEKESKAIDANIRMLLEKIAETSLHTTLTNYIDNTSQAKHQKNQQFVANCIQELEILANSFRGFPDFLKETLSISYLEGDQTPSSIKEGVNQAILDINQKLLIFSSTLDNKEMLNQCYRDTKIDVYTTYAHAIHVLSDFAHDVLTPCLEIIDQMEQNTAQIDAYSRLIDDFSNYSISGTNQESLSRFNQIIDSIPDQIDLNTENIEQEMCDFFALNEKLDLIGQYEDLIELESNIRAFQLSPEDGVLHQKIMSKPRKFADIKQMFRTTDFQDNSSNLLFQEIEKQKQALLDQANVTVDTFEKQSDIQAQIVQKTHDIGEAKKVLITSIHEKKDPLHNKIGGFIQKLNAQFDVFIIYEERIRESVQNLSVGGCIAIGELEISNNLKPLIDAITPHITHSVNTLLNSLADPFHYKQLLIRLFLLDIAEETGPCLDR